MDDRVTPAAPHAPPTSAPAPVARKRRRAWQRLALVVGSTLVALPLAELGYRAVLWARGRPYDAHATDEQLRALASGMNESMPRTDPKTGEEPFDGKAVHPYIGVDSRGGMATGEVYAKRFLGGEYDDAFTVVVVGGSVAAITGTTNSDAMIAALTKDARLAGRRAVVIPQGRGGLKQPQQATLVAYLFAMGWDPDAVINIDGFNEVALAWGNVESGVHPLHPDYPGWGLIAARRSDLSQEIRLAGRIVDLAEGARDTVDAALAGGWTRSAIVGNWVVARVSGSQARWSSLQGEYAAILAGGKYRNPAKGPLLTAPDDEIARRIIDGWYESSLNLHAMCAARGIQYVHVLQPTLHDTGSKELTPEEVAMGQASDTWMRAVHVGYPLLRAAGERLKAKGVAFVDLSGIFRDLHESTYYDMCHFRGRGADLFAARVIEELLARYAGEIPRRDRRAQR